MVPGKLQHHSETNHSKIKEKGIDYTKYRYNELIKRHKLLQTFTPEMRKPGSIFQGELLQRIGWETTNCWEMHCWMSAGWQCNIWSIVTFPGFSNLLIHKFCYKDWVDISGTELHFALQVAKSIDVTGLAILLTLVQYEYKIII